MERFVNTAIILIGLLFVLLAFMAIASEDIVAPTDKKTLECQEKYFDHIFIAQAKGNGAQREKLEALAQHSISVLGQAHLDAIMKLIDEAYAAQDVVEWLNGYWEPCVQEAI